MYILDVAAQADCLVGSVGAIGLPITYSRSRHALTADAFELIFAARFQARRVGGSVVSASGQ